MERALAVAGHDPARVDAIGAQQTVGRHIGGAHADQGEFQALQRLADQARGVDERGEDDGRRPLLVVVPDGDLQALAQHVEYVEAFGLGDILQIDAAEAGLEQLDGTDDVLGCFAAQADRHGIHTPPGI